MNKKTLLKGFAFALLATIIVVALLVGINGLVVELSKHEGWMAVGLFFSSIVFIAGSFLGFYELGLIVEKYFSSKSKSAIEDQKNVLELLNKIQFFGGQRAGRELWSTKPEDVQNRDLAEFNAAVEVVRKFITKGHLSDERLNDKS